MARALKSIKDKQKVNFKQSFEALKYLPRFFKEVYHASPHLFFANVACRLLNAMTPVLILYVGKLLIDELILQIGQEEQDLNNLWTYVIIELVLAASSDVLGRITSLTDGLLGDRYSIQSSVRIIQKTKSLEISDLEDSSFYDKLERARQQTTGRVGLLSTALSQIQDFIVIGSLIAGLIYFEPILVGILIISIIPSFINEISFSSSRYSLARSWTAERRELDYLRYIGANYITSKEMKLFGLTDFVGNRFRVLADKYYEVNKKLSTKRTLYGSIFNLLGTLSYYGAYVLIILRALAGLISIGDVTFLAGSFNRLRNSVQSSFSKFTRISENALYLGDYFEYLDFQPTTNVFTAQPIPSTIKYGFEFKDVYFRYPGGSHDILKGVSFHIQVREKMAFVGQNGAGKTTLVKLLLRFYEPSSGTILLDGQDIKTFNKEAYQKMFGVIFQDFVRYEFTAGENIAVGNISKIKDAKAIKEAAHQSLANEVIEALEAGMDQQLGRRFAKGVNLSGGQWQKIALARAYIKDSQVVILDEPTSALDARAEFEAFQRFIELTRGKTSIIISHRFSTVRMADRIIVLKDGVISESGSHDDLMKQNKLYAELFTLQARGYH